MVGDSLDYAFDRVWRSLAAAGQVDEIDGAEYDRVRREWERSGHPNWTAREIIACANNVHRTQA